MLIGFKAIPEKYLRYPGSPVDSMWLAIVTSSDHISYCHFLKKQDHINITENIRTLIKRVTAFLMLKQHNINSKSDQKSICFKNYHAKFEIDRAILIILSLN